MNDQRNRRKVQEHTKKLTVNLINPLREGKRLLVLDIDYSESGLPCGRYKLMAQDARSDLGYEAPYIWRSATAGMCEARATRVPGGCIPPLRHLHLVVWTQPSALSLSLTYARHFRSQTSWVWLETKLVELGMLGGVRNYRVSLLFLVGNVG